jgi:hypothetical protein
MTAPIPSIGFSPPLETHGRTAKELMGAAETPDAGAGTGIGFLDVDVTFEASMNPIRIKTIFDAPTFFTTSAMKFYHPRNATLVRLVITSCSAPPAAARAILECNPTRDHANPAAWVNPGIMGRECTVSLDTSAAPEPKRGGWCILDKLIKKQDMPWRVRFLDGDNLSVYAYAQLAAQFRIGPPIPEEQWYLRLGAPAAGPSVVPSGGLPLVDFWASGTGYSGGIVGAHGFGVVGPNPPPGHLNLLRGGALGVAAGAGTIPNDGFDHASFYDAVAAHWWVGPPLEGQVLPAFDYRLQFAAEDFDAHSAGYALWSVGVWRPGVGIIAQWYEDSTNVRNTWFRFVSRGWEIAVSSFDETDLLEDDRLFVAVDLVHDWGGGIGTNGGAGPQIQYEGPTDINVGGFQGGLTGASNVVVPKLVYKSLYAT